MPTSTINATYQGRVILNVSNFFVNWLSQVRNATTGSLASTYTTNTTVTDAFKVEYNSSRGFETGQ